MWSPFKSRQRRDEMTEPQQAIAELPEELLWLLDAPLFIDQKQVDAFYDAVIRPDYEGTSLTLSNSITHETTLGGKVTVGAALPWLAKAEAEVSGEAARKAE